MRIPFAVIAQIDQREADVGLKLAHQLSEIGVEQPEFALQLVRAGLDRELAAAAAQLPVPKKDELKFKSPSEWRYVSKGHGSYDLEDICTGKAKFGMDARIDVFAALGLHLGEAHVIRNAGGRVTDDVLRSLALSFHVLGVDKPAAPVSAIMDQVNRTFVPDLLVIPTGSNIEFPNSDSVSHQIYSFSPAHKFQLPLYRGKPYPPEHFDQIFSKRGLVPFKT